MEQDLRLTCKSNQRLVGLSTLHPEPGKEEKEPTTLLQSHTSFEDKMQQYSTSRRSFEVQKIRLKELKLSRFKKVKRDRSLEY